MAAIATAYGIRIYTNKEIRGHEEKYTCIDTGCWIESGYYDYLCEIIDENENYED